MNVNGTQRFRSTIAANAFSGDLETQKSQKFYHSELNMVAFQGVAKLSTSAKVIIFSPLVPYSSILD